MNSFLFTFYYTGVQTFWVTSKTSIWIYVAVLFAEHCFTKLFVTGLIGLSHGAVKYSNSISIKNFYASFFKMSGKLGVIIKIPVLIFEKAETFADTTTFWFFFLFGIGTSATFCTILVLFKNCITHFIPFIGIFFDLVIPIMSCWTIQH